MSTPSGQEPDAPEAGTSEPLESADEPAQTTTFPFYTGGWTQPYSISSLAPTVGAKYDPTKDREQTRAKLAGGLAVLLGIMGILLIALTAAGTLTLEQAKDLAEVIFAPVVVLTGTALGFYFGVHQGGDR